MLSTWRELSRLIDVHLRPDRRALATLALLAHGVVVGIGMYELFTAPPLTLVARVATGIEGVGVIPVTIPAYDSGGTWIAMSWYRWYTRQRAQNPDTDLCLDARLGYVTDGRRRIRLASVPAGKWVSYGSVEALPVSVTTPRCPRREMPEGSSISHYAAELTSGSSFLLVGRIEPEGRDWRTVDGYGISLDSSPNDLVHNARERIIIVGFMAFYTTLSALALALVLFGGPRTRWFFRRRDGA